MGDKLEKYIEELFHNAPNTVRAQEFKEEMLRNNQEKLNDLIASGMSEEEAYQTVLSGIGDMTGFFETLAEEEAEQETPSSCNHKKKKTKRRLSAAAIVFIVIGGVLLSAVTAVALGIVNYRYRSYETSEEAPEELITGYEFQPEEIQEIEVNWVSGNVTVEYAEMDIVDVQELGVTGPHMAMQIYEEQEKGKLIINYCEDRWDSLFSGDYEKELFIQLPQELSDIEIEISTVSGDIMVDGSFAKEDCFLKEVSAETVSGEIALNDCNANEISMNTTSGEISLTGKAADVDCSSISGKIDVALFSDASEIEVETTSGNTTLRLPKTSSYSFNFHTTSGDFSTDFPYITEKDGRTCWGEGPFGRITCESVSGDLAILFAE